MRTGRDVMDSGAPVSFQFRAFPCDAMVPRPLTGSSRALVEMQIRCASCKTHISESRCGAPGTRSGGCAELIYELAELSTAAVAEAENLDAEMTGGPHLAHDRMNAKAEAVDLEAHLDLVADEVAGHFAVVD